ncbi:RNA polymerase sigma-70 factor, ECF subfamily [Neorhodopirellula lusitana]|uniref:RNA polymerase sigma-70 factor, ECF subfamily n=1 Tax=Neorhodopirellula lusitana TaxID=445327 RepID=A0ABY1QQ98_9BACT|nr:sigma-70 family RNA polymerase sigma factor [Neorhodopirellula lusitana]SMP74829.1 RNA polymerase sigma-70 factor, ECF subfamily [Neorhodopirellula lusitana]
MNNDSPNFELSPAWVLHLTEAQPRLLGYLLKRVAQLDQAHEVLQEVNLVLCRNASDFEEGTDFMAWAFSIARFQILAFRKRQSRDRLTFPDDLAEELDSLDGELFTAGPEFARESALRDCISKLPPVQQSLVLQRYAESVSVKSLAAEMDKSANAISMILHRCRTQLMKCVELTLAAASE